MDPKIVVHAVGNFGRLNSDLNRTQSGLSRLGRTAAKGAAIGLGLAGAAAIKFGIDSAKSLARIERINAQTVSAIKATGGAAHVSAADVEELTGALENRTATEAESIQQGANFLLTFRNIRNEAGKGNKIFDKSVVALTDMSRAMDKTGSSTLDMQKGALQLGKALNDPVKGITALTRVGVSFTDQQVKTIKSLTESGDTMKAQKIILRELTKEFGGSGEAFAKTTTGKIELAKHALGTFGETITGALLPAIADLAVKGTKGLEFLTDHADDFKDAFEDVKDAVAPAVDEIVEAFGHLIDNGDGLSGMFEDKLLPALETTSEIIGALVNFVDELPGPVKNLGGEVALAAIAFSVLSGWAGKASAALGTAGLTGSAATAETRLKALRSAAGTAAGVGGLLLLAKSSQEANDGLAALERTAGGAFIGFAAGGPIGAAVGATIGLATSFDDLQGAMYGWLGVTDPAKEEARLLAGVTNAAADAAERYKVNLDALTGTLNQGKNSAASLGPAYQNLVGQLEANGVSAATADRQWRLLGISQRTVAQASLGNADALKRINQAYNTAPLGKRIINEHTLADAIDNTARLNRIAIREERARLRLTQEWGGKLKAFPKQARTAIKLDGVQPTLKGLARVVTQYKNIDKKDIRTLLEVTGVDASVADVKRAAKELATTDKKSAKPKVEVQGAPAARDAINGVRGLLQSLQGDAAHTYIYTHRVTVYESRGTPSGRSNVPRTLVGDPFGFDTLNEFVEVDGRAVAAKAERAGRDIIARLLRGITGGRDDVKSALGRITDLIEKRVNLKDDKKERAREKAIIKHLKGQYDALTRIGKAHDAINRKLERAREHLAEVQQFADTIRDTLVETGNVTNLIDQGRPVTANNLIRNLQSQVDKAEKFADVIRQLTDDVGTQLNETTLQQLLAAGPAGGLDEALALLTGGDAALQQFNDLTGQLVSTGTELGSQMTDVMFDVGLDGATALVEGLEAENAALNRAARRLARKLANAVRHALAGLGHKAGDKDSREANDAMRGLTLGLDETTARRHGERLAAAMLQGFGSPRLDANVGARGAAPAFTVKLTGEQQSQLQRGKQILLDINAAKGAGVRTVAVGPS